MTPVYSPNSTEIVEEPNVVADLTQNGEFARGWGLVFFHDLPCGRFSSSFQPFFSPIPVGWLWTGLGLRRA